MAPQHRFTIVVDIPDEQKSQDAENWDREDLTFALVDGSAVVTEIDDHEEFEE
jgi:hypothetical protein